MGVSDREKNIIIPLKYDQTYPFIDDVALVRIEDKYGLISSKGEILIPVIHYDGEVVIDEAFDKGWRSMIPRNHYPKIPVEVIKEIEAIKEFSDGISPFKKINESFHVDKNQAYYHTYQFFKAFDADIGSFKKMDDYFTYDKTNIYYFAEYV